jgi:hypothetical protein
VITVLLVNDYMELRVFRYRTDAPEDACRHLLADWIDGAVIWDMTAANAAFTPEWLERNGLDPFHPAYLPRIANGVREVEWWFAGPTEGDDVRVRGYFVPCPSPPSTLEAG